MSLSLVTVRSYASELEAEIGRATLEANGIDAIVHRGDAAGLLRAVQPAELVVHRDDAARAIELLEVPFPAEADPEQPPTA